MEDEILDEEKIEQEKILAVVKEELEKKKLAEKAEKIRIAKEERSKAAIQRAIKQVEEAQEKECEYINCKEKFYPNRSWQRFHSEVCKLAQWDIDNPRNLKRKQLKVLKMTVCKQCEKTYPMVDERLIICYDCIAEHLATAE